MRYRIGIDAHVLNGKYQGSRTWLTEVLIRVQAMRPDITFVVYSFAPEETRKVIDGANVEHRRIPRKLPACLRLLAFWPLVAELHRLDALMVQYIAPPLTLRRTIVVVHDILFETHPQFFPWTTRWRNRLFVRLGVARAEAVVTVSSYSREAIARAYRIDRGRIHIAPNGAARTAPGDLPAGIDKDTRYALFVGRLEPRKNLSGLLDAFAEVKQPDVLLVVVGCDDFEGAATLQKLKADPRVRHFSAIPSKTLAALYAHAKILAFPSFAEGFGIPILEAFAQGCPVIAANATAMPEIAGAAAHYFDPLAPDATARLTALLSWAYEGVLIHDPAEGRARLDHFSWEKAAGAVVAAMEASVKNTI